VVDFCESGETVILFLSKVAILVTVGVLIIHVTH